MTLFCEFFRQMSLLTVRTNTHATLCVSRWKRTFAQPSQFRSGLGRDSERSSRNTATLCLFKEKETVMEVAAVANTIYRVLMTGTNTGEMSGAKFFNSTRAVFRFSFSPGGVEAEKLIVYRLEGEWIEKNMGKNRNSHTGDWWLTVTVVGLTCGVVVFFGRVVVWAFCFLSVWVGAGFFLDGTSNTPCSYPVPHFSSLRSLRFFVLHVCPLRWLCSALRWNEGIFL